MWNAIQKFLLVAGGLIAGSVAVLAVIQAMQITPLPGLNALVVSSWEDSSRVLVTIILFVIEGIILSAALWLLYLFAGNRIHAMLRWSWLEWIIFGYDVALVVLFPLMARLHLEPETEKTVIFWWSLVCFVYIAARSMKLAMYIYANEVLPAREGWMQLFGLFAPYTGLVVAYWLYMTSPEMQFSKWTWALFAQNFMAISITMLFLSSFIVNLLRASPIAERKESKVDPASRDE